MLAETGIPDISSHTKRRANNIAGNRLCFGQWALGSAAQPVAGSEGTVLVHFLRLIDFVLSSGIANCPYLRSRRNAR